MSSQDFLEVVELHPCPVCTARLPAAELEQHVSHHFSDDIAADQSPYEAPDAVHCQECGTLVPLHELDSHEEAHRLHVNDEQGDALALALAAEAQRQEEEQFAALQARYGFTDKAGLVSRMFGNADADAVRRLVVLLLLLMLCCVCRVLCAS